MTMKRSKKKQQNLIYKIRKQGLSTHKASPVTPLWQVYLHQDIPFDALGYFWYLPKTLCYLHYIGNSHWDLLNSNGEVLICTNDQNRLLQTVETLARILPK
jgi:hypothetical protein